MSKGLEVWNAVKKYLNLYHHQTIKANIDVETVEGMPIDIIDKSLKALEKYDAILKRYDVDDLSALEKIISDYDSLCEDVIKVTTQLSATQEFLNQKGLSKECKLYVQKRIREMSDSNA